MLGPESERIFQRRFGRLRRDMGGRGVATLSLIPLGTEHCIES